MFHTWRNGNQRSSALRSAEASRAQRWHRSTAAWRAATAAATSASAGSLPDRKLLQGRREQLWSRNWAQRKCAADLDAWENQRQSGQPVAHPSMTKPSAELAGKVAAGKACDGKGC